MPLLSRAAACTVALLPLAPMAGAGAMPLTQVQPGQQLQQGAPAAQPAAAAPQAPAAQPQQTGAQDEQQTCPNSGQKPAKQKSPLAQDTGAAVGGTAGQIAGAALLGPIGAAAVAVLGSHAGKKAGGVVKTKKKAESQDVPAECSELPPQNNAPAQAGENANSPAPPQSPPTSGTK